MLNELDKELVHKSKCQLTVHPKSKAKMKLTDSYLELNTK